MSELTGQDGPRLVAERQVEPLWQEVAGTAGRTDPLIGFAEPQARAIVKALAKHAPKKLRFSAGTQTAELRDLLVRPQPVTGADVPDGSMLPQVLHAAWQWRMSNWYAGADVRARVSQRALQLCLLVSP